MKFFLILLIVIVLIRFAIRIIFNSAYHGLKKAADDFRKQQEADAQKPEGSITIQHPGNVEDSSRKQGGEYIDYEEIR